MNKAILILISSISFMAAGPAKAADPDRTFGTFHAGDTFTLSVTERSSINSKADEVNDDADIPAGVPDFTVGQTVDFTIGKRGQLKGAGFSITYRDRIALVNGYSNNATWSIPEGDAASVVKTRKGSPFHATLTFYRFSFSGFIPVTHIVTYVLE